VPVSNETIYSQYPSATGLISSWFVADLDLPRPDAKANHIIHSIGSSSLDKCKDFAAKHIKNGKQPKLYGSYDEVYNDPEVDCVYIGSPHGSHKRDMLKAIEAGKNILCEKAFTMNAKEAKEVFAAAEKKGVYVHEAMWLRHRPMLSELRKLLYQDKVIGDVFRTTSDFQMYLDMDKLSAESRYKRLDLGAGSLLDIGIYPLSWLLLTLDPDLPEKPQNPKILASQSFRDGVEVTTSVILHYEDSGRQGIMTSTTERKNGARKIVATIDGTNGFIEVEGGAPSHPKSFTVYPKWTGDQKPEGKKYDHEYKWQGFVYEADNTALDIAAGRKENSIMPWSETIRVMEVMDEIRRQGGTKYPVD
jgi:predicted dehydrogenase